MTSRNMTLDVMSRDMMSRDAYDVTIFLVFFLAFVMIYVRYKQVKEYNKQDLSRILRLNTWSAVVGAIAVVGLMLVASFQVS